MYFTAASFCLFFCLIHQSLEHGCVAYLYVSSRCSICFSTKLLFNFLILFRNSSSKGIPRSTINKFFGHFLTVSIKDVRSLTPIDMEDLIDQN